MTAQAHEAQSDLIDRLPFVRGKYIAQMTLADMCWFRVGGVADIVFLPADADDLATFLRGTAADIPLYVVGVGSNILVRDGGYRGVIIRLGRGFSAMRHEGGTCVRAGAGALDAGLARMAVGEGLSGIEFFSGIPGSVGGALAMNAGAYGSETRDILVRATAYDRQGRKHILERDAMRFAYRENARAEGLIFTEAQFALHKGDMGRIQKRMDEIAAARSDSQPIRARTGGSTFKNPTDKKIKAWELLDAAGCRGLRVGDAEFSQKHCNFLINRGHATAADLEACAEAARGRVRAHSNYELEWEIRRLGVGDEGSALL